MRMTYPDIHMAYMCVDTLPLELFYFSGIKLTKIKGDGAVSYNSKSFFPSYMCSYAMSCLDIIIREEEKYDCFIFSDRCHAMITLYEYIREYLPHKKTIMISVPRTESVYSKEYYQNEVLRLNRFLKMEFGFNISGDKIKKNYLEVKKLIDSRNDILNHIAEKSLPLTSEILKILEEFPGIHIKDRNSLDSLEKEVVNSTNNKHNEPELFLCGMHVTPLDIIDVIHDYGGKVVLFDNLESIGIDHFDSDKDAEFELTNWNSGLLKGFGWKLEKYKIKGLIFSTIKFCPIQSYRIMLLTEMAKNKKIPFLVLNDSFSNKCTAQIHTRIQAFIECLE